MARWYYCLTDDETAELGPAEFRELAEMVRDGILSPSSKIRKEYTSLHVSVRHVRGLAFDDLFQPPEEVAPEQSRTASGPSASSQAERLWEQTLGLAAGSLSETKSPREGSRFRWGETKKRRAIPSRRSHRWRRVVEAVAVSTIIAGTVWFACSRYLEQPQRYPIPQRLQAELGEGARYLFGTGPWSPSETLVFTWDVCLLAAVAAGIGYDVAMRNRNTG